MVLNKFKMCQNVKIWTPEGPKLAERIPVVDLNIAIWHALNWYHMIVYQMEFHRTRWSCPWNSDQNYAKLCYGVAGVKGMECLGVVGSLRVMGVDTEEGSVVQGLGIVAGQC